MRQPGHIRLGVNIDHVATIRNARGGRHPDPLRAAQIAAEAGADGITAHLREDRRHILDDDIFRLSKEVHLPLNMECAAASEMLDIALRIRPHAVCLVPERREEKTTEGGLDVAGQHNQLRSVAGRLRDAGIRVSLFINPDLRQIEAAGRTGADIIELHAGAYCEAINEGNLAAARAEIALHRRAARIAAEQGLEVHAGHGIAFDTVAAFAAIPQVVELNIGHFLIGEAVFMGLHDAIRHMRGLMDGARG